MAPVPYAWEGPLKSTGKIDQFSKKDLTPGLGSDFQNLDLAAALQSPDKDAIFRDLAIEISTRGVAVFRNQHLDNETHKQAVDAIAKGSGRPKDNTLMTNALYPLYGDDPQVITLIPERVAERYGYKSSQKKRQNHAHEWHSDMSFEENPSDYSSLRLGQVPPTGGDTCYASCYELYDRLSEPFQKFFETLQVQWGDPHYVKACETEGTYRGCRGSPANCNHTFDAVHPFVRTNPVSFIHRSRWGLV
jgi:alpha-ketoglutarate-dependent taurine dioxygenase